MARRKAGAGAFAAGIHPTIGEDAVETSESAGEYENEEAVGDVMDEVEDEKLTRYDPETIKVVRLANGITPNSIIEDRDSPMTNTDSVEGDIPDRNDASTVLTASDPEETSETAKQIDTAARNTGATQTLHDPTSPTTMPNESVRDATHAVFALRRTHAEAGSLCESCHLDKYALEGELHSLPPRPPPEHQSYQLSEGRRLQLKLSLVEADTTFYKVRMELADWKLRSEKDVVSPLSSGKIEREMEVLVARVRKAWYDAEVPFRC